MARSLWIVLAVTLFGCDGSASVDFNTGPIRAAISLDEIDVPSALRSGSGASATVASVPCSASMACPSVGGSPLVLECSAGTCDPRALDIVVPLGGVLDFDMLAGDLRAVIDEVDRIVITGARVDVESNTLTLGLPAAQIHWGPEGAATVNPSLGTHLLGTMPAIEARAVGTQPITLDSNGNEALSRHLVDTARRARFFVVAPLDLEPGTAFPSGIANVSVSLSVRAEGKVID